MTRRRCRRSTRPAGRRSVKPCAARAMRRAMASGSGRPGAGGRIAGRAALMRPSPASCLIAGPVRRAVERPRSGTTAQWNDRAAGSLCHHRPDLILGGGMASDGMQSGARSASSAQLVAAAAGGDATAWRAIVERFEQLLWAVARGHRLGQSEAADVVQTTWLRLVENLDRIRDPDHLGAWLATTCLLYTSDAADDLRCVDLGGRRVLK